MVPSENSLLEMTSYFYPNNNIVFEGFIFFSLNFVLSHQLPWEPEMRQNYKNETAWLFLPNKEDSRERGVSVQLALI